MNDSKKRILDVAMNLFLQKTYKEVSIQEISDKAGMTKGAFYYHYKSKEQLFLEIVNQFSARTQVNFDKIKAKSLFEFYHDYFKGLADNQNRSKDIIGTDQNYYFLTFYALKIFPDFRKKMWEYEQTELEAWIKAIADAKKNGEIKSGMSDKQIAEFFIYTGDGVGMRNILLGKSIDIKNKILKLWDSFYSELKI